MTNYQRRGPQRTHGHVSELDAIEGDHGQSKE